MAAVSRYLANGRLLSEIKCGPIQQHTRILWKIEGHTTSYSYDAESNRTGFTDPESGSTTYTYDTLNRLTSLTPPAAFSSAPFNFSYDALSRRTQMTRPNGINTNYTYDSLSRLLSVLHQSGASTIDGATYTVDAAGNRTSKADYLPKMAKFR
jgi:YD repeat-containing protein